MALINKTLGAAIIASIGRRGEAPSHYPGLIVSAPQITMRSTGRMAEVANVILVQKNLSGELYLSARIQDLAFCEDRDLSTTRVEALDGTEDQPKGWQEVVRDQAASAKAFADARPAPSNRAQTVSVEPVTQSMALDAINADMLAEIKAALRAEIEAEIAAAAPKRGSKKPAEVAA